MKNMVTLDEIREVEMRSQEIFVRYSELLKTDIPAYFGEKEEFERTVCPACRAENFRDEFEKLGFEYRSCRDCATMFVARRPSDEALLRYHEGSQSHRFYETEYLQTLQEHQGGRIFRSRIDWILDSVLKTMLRGGLFWT